MAKAVATVEDFEKLANDIGLVPMTHLVPTITELPGDVRGYAPYTALRMYNDGLAEPVKGLSKAPAQQQRPAVDPDLERKGAIAIPDTWDDEHHLKRIALAKQIAGSDASLTAEAADRIIADELARRSALADTVGGPNAVTSRDVIAR